MKQLVSAGQLVVVDRGYSVRNGTVAFVKEVAGKTVVLSSGERTSLSDIRIIKISEVVV